MQIARKRSFFNTATGGSSSYDWDYSKYINQIESCKDSYISLTPTIQKRITIPILIQNGALKPALYENKQKLIYVKQNGYYAVYDLDTQTEEFTYTGIQFTSGCFGVKMLPDNKLILCSYNNIYLADDIYCSNIRKIATLNNLITSNFGIRYSLDYQARYLDVWYNETTVISRLHLDNFTTETINLSGIRWMYTSMVLPDDSLMCTTVGQVVHRFSGSSFATHVQSTHGSYAGYAGATFVVADQCMTCGTGTRSGKYNYWNMYTTQPVSTLSYGNSDHISTPCHLACGQYMLVNSVNTSSGIAVGMYLQNVITGYLQKVTYSNTFDSSSVAITLLNGQVLYGNYNSTSYDILDFGLTKKMNLDALTSPWFLNTYII